MTIPAETRKEIREPSHRRDMRKRRAVSPVCLALILVPILSAALGRAAPSAAADPRLRWVFDAGG